MELANTLTRIACFKNILNLRVPPVGMAFHEALMDSMRLFERGIPASSVTLLRSRSIPKAAESVRKRLKVVI